MKKVYIIDAKRSAIGKFLGSLYEADASDVCSQIIRKGFGSIIFSVWPGTQTSAFSDLKIA